jgi:hypothetical protein
MYFSPWHSYRTDETFTKGGALLRIMTPRLRRLPKEPNLSRLRDLPRAEAIRIAMIKYGWDAATAAKRVDNGREEPDRDR